MKFENKFSNLADARRNVSHSAKYRKKIIGAVGLAVIFGLCFATFGKGGSVSFLDKDMEVFLPEENDDVPEKKKTAFLTFDDGPSVHTEEILDILEKEGACATFFLIGDQITDEEVPVLKKLIKNGNEIGIHTYSHNEEIYSSKTAFLKDFCMARDAISDKLGIEPKIYRFPWGSTSRYVKPYKKELTKMLAQCGYQYEDWNVSAEDSIGRPGAETIIANIKKDLNKHEEPVILMHDSQINKETVRALPQIISMIREEGYSFGVLSERSEPMQY